MFNPTFVITNKILTNISKIEAAEEVIKHSLLLPLWEKQFKEEALIRSAYHGTHIEGNNLHKDDAKDVLMGKDVIGRPRDIQEIINYRRVIEYIDDEAMIGEACTNNPKDGDKNFNGSAVGFISKLIVTPFANPPASGVMWAYEGLQNAGFVPKTMAAEGIGFAAIKPFANLWKIFRDVAYMFLVIILIAIGFMIMFRAKINPQTVISVENALPKIVISLILITFSFAIAGFLIDLMYVSIIIIISILSNGNTFYNAIDYQNKYIGGNFGDLIKSIAVGDLLLTAPKIGDALIGIIPQAIVSIFRVLSGVATVIITASLFHNALINPISSIFNDIGAGTINLGKIWGAIVQAPFSFIVMFVIYLFGTSFIFSVIIFFLIGGTILYMGFRIFMILFMSYLKTLLLVIIAPFLLIFEAVPGKNIFSWWLKNLLGNLIAFPITITILLIGYIIVNSSLPVGYNDMRLPFLYGIESNSFKILVGMGLIFLIPDIIKLTKEALAIKDLPLNIGIGTFFGGATAVGGGAMGLVGQYGSMMLGAQYLPIIGKMLRGTPPPGAPAGLTDTQKQALSVLTPPVSTAGGPPPGAGT